MGWMRTLLLGDLGNRLDIADTEREIRSVKTASTRARAQLAAKTTQISALRSELGRQKLAIEALTRFLVAKGLIDSNELGKFIESVDAEDGELDGRLAFDGSTGKLRLIIPQD